MAVKLFSALYKNVQFLTRLDGDRLQEIPFQNLLDRHAVFLGDRLHRLASLDGMNCQNSFVFR